MEFDWNFSYISNDSSSLLSFNLLKWLYILVQHSRIYDMWQKPKFSYFFPAPSSYHIVPHIIKEILSPLFLPILVTPFLPLVPRTEHNSPMWSISSQFFFLILLDLSVGLTRWPLSTHSSTLFAGLLGHHTFLCFFLLHWPLLLRLFGWFLLTTSTF